MWSFTRTQLEALFQKGFGTFRDPTSRTKRTNRDEETRMLPAHGKDDTASCGTCMFRHVNDEHQRVWSEEVGLFVQQLDRCPIAKQQLAPVPNSGNETNKKPIDMPAVRMKSAHLVSSIKH